MGRKPFFSETQASETKCTEACKSNYPTREALWDNEKRSQIGKSN
jgi:hypothetical protein